MALTFSNAVFPPSLHLHLCFFSGFSFILFCCCCCLFLFKLRIGFIYLFIFGCTESWLWHVESSSLTRDRTPASCIGVLATGSPGSPLWLFYMESQVSFSAHFGPLFTSHLNQHREPRGPRDTRGLPLRCLYLWAAGGKGGWGKKRGANTSILKLLKDICHICTTKAQFKKKKVHFLSIYQQQQQLQPWTET